MKAFTVFGWSNAHVFHEGSAQRIGAGKADLGSDLFGHIALLFQKQTSSAYARTLYPYRRRFTDFS